MRPPPDSIALRGGTDEWTYRQLHRASGGYAGALAAAGLSPGDRVLLAAPSVPEFVVAYLGIQAAGCVVVPVNTMSTRAEVEYVLGDAACSLAIAWHVLGSAVAEAATALDVPFWTLTPGASVTGATPADVVDRDRDATAAILYTSGTTGPPKGAQLTVGNLLSAGEIGAECSRTSSADRIGSGLPLFHVFDQASVLMGSAYKIPRIVRFVDALPKGPTGKILKRAVDRSVLTRDIALGDVAAGRR
ncbi:AMP-binding protein [Streptomyces chartreusis]|uniref:AMP-binding protein n=1 Tax=Streptomyces chartreusis TaxID=1969 RepID=UPI0038231E11